MRWTGLALIFGFWTLMALLSAGNAYIEHDADTGWILYEAQSKYLWALLTPLIFWLCRRYSTSRYPLSAVILIHLVAALSISIFCNVVDEIARDMLRYERSTPIERLIEQQLLLDFYREFLVYAAILAAGFAFDFYSREKERQAESARLQTQLVQARLQALRMQLHPHFLFNTLNTISAMTERDAAKARRLIARLSELLRRALENTEKQVVPLSEELSFLRGYVEIVQARMEGRLEVLIDAGPEVEDTLVPSLILQPLVENAIEHGVSGMSRGGVVRVEVQAVSNRLQLSVWDNGPGMSTNNGTGSGVGLKNTRSRLEALYGDASEMRLSNGEEGGFRVDVIIPYQEASSIERMGAV